METPSHCLSSPVGPWDLSGQTKLQEAVECCGVVLPLTGSPLWLRVDTELEVLWAPSALVDGTLYPNNVREKKFPMCKSLFPNYFTI